MQSLSLFATERTEREESALLRPAQNTTAAPEANNLWAADQDSDLSDEFQDAQATTQEK